MLNWNRVRLPAWHYYPVWEKSTDFELSISFFKIIWHCDWLITVMTVNNWLLWKSGYCDEGLLITTGYFEWLLLMTGYFEWLITVNDWLIIDTSYL